ncbi:MAG: DEAD/DEAH box helicase [Acidimicrobiales bacterium]
MADTPFSLDRFQLEAIAALDDGRSVLVAAPTGSGKTVVADAAIDMARHAGGRTFYTTPIKALSNQKYSDLVARLGAADVGLLTGDTAINGDAEVVVMTTEVLRNMIYSASNSLDRLHVVVLDEVHYLQDAYRGPVWEEVIIGLPPHVRLVCLSATVSNAAELGEWIETVRGPTATVIEHERPVELENLYLVGDRTSERDHLVPVMVDGRPNPEGYRFDVDPRAGKGGRPAERRRRFVTPRRVETIERLAEEDLLPVIYFIFSRNACDDAMAVTRDSGLRFTNAEERLRIRAIAEASVTALSDADLDVLGYDMWLAGLEQGIAAHHAGLIPAFKEAVERCFVEGLVKVVFATETLALGINMPARSVAIEKLSKYNGETHEFLTPAQFTQLTGRAGRRGIDDEGFSVVLWSPFVSFNQVAGLVGSREFPLTSSFRPTYNMAANLVRRYERSEAMSLLGQSFAQFQADRAVVTLERRLVRDSERLAALEPDTVCELGDVAEYTALAERVSGERRHRPDGRVAVERAVSLLRPGDIITPLVRPDTAERLELAPGERPRLVVLSVAYRGKGAIRVRTVDQSGRPVQLVAADLDDPPRAAVAVELPSPYAPHDPAFLDETARRLRASNVPPPSAAPSNASRWERLLAELEAHPVHECPDRDRHVEALADYRRLVADRDRATKQLHKRTSSIVRRFESVSDLLGSLGFLDGWSLTEAGERLARIYHERDLIVAMALDDGVFDGLDAAGTAAMVAAVVYEDRRPDGSEPVFPNANLRQRFGRLERLSERIARAERERGLPQTRPPDAGFMAACHGWAAGRDLGGLIDGEMSGGDFVRTTKMVIDVLSQLAEIAPDLGTRRSAGAAVEALRRGVVADFGPSTPLPLPESAGSGGVPAEDGERR